MSILISCSRPFPFFLQTVILFPPFALRQAIASGCLIFPLFNPPPSLIALAFLHPPFPPPLLLFSLNFLPTAVSSVELGYNSPTQLRFYPRVLTWVNPLFSKFSSGSNAPLSSPFRALRDTFFTFLSRLPFYSPPPALDFRYVKDEQPSTNAFGLFPPPPPLLHQGFFLLNS